MSTELTLEEKACNFDTSTHIHRVRDLLGGMMVLMLERCRLHDRSKMEPPEVAAFTAMTPKLRKMDFGTPEYEESKKALGEALVHHYANNRHHPEHFPRGIRDMNVIDLIEMLCDWKAGSERHDSGNIRKSIEHNALRFNFPHELNEIFMNSIDLFVPAR